MQYLYILYSSTVNQYYIGETHNTAQRLLKHNNRSYEGSFTKIATDWEIVLEFECVSRHQAIYLEKFIKKMKSTVFTQKIIANPAILKDIISKNNF